MKLDDAVNCVVEEYSLLNDKEAILDPSTFVVFTELLVILLPLLFDCMTSDQLAKAAKKPTLLNRLALSLRIRNILGPKQFRQFGDQVLKALYSAGSKITVEDFESLRNEV